LDKAFMKVMQINASGRDPLLVPGELAQPQPQAGEVLVRVHAAGVIPTELGWSPTTQKKDGTPRKSAVLTHEFSGSVAALGKGVTGIDLGDAIYGMNDWYAEGALAEFCITRPENIAPKPASLNWDEAASVPISALTAWQGLFERAKMQQGDRVLVQGGTGAVGAYVVQLAHAHGAYVIATVSARDMGMVKQLGADQAIDYRGKRFEEETGKVDIVFDTVGGTTLDRSWNILKPGGRMVTIVSENVEHAEQREKDAFFIVEPSRQQLIAVAEMLDAGKLKTFVKAVVPLDKAAEAYTGAVRSENAGKIVVAVAA
jgi:NADPH:quinone reductase-like Zn-dependent oxidoreductase